MQMICVVLKKTFLFFKLQYFESDNYRHVKMMEILVEEK